MAANCVSIFWVVHIVFGCFGLFWDVSVVLGCLGCFGPPWDVLVVLGCLDVAFGSSLIVHAVSRCFELFRLLGCFRSFW